MTKSSLLCRLLLFPVLLAATISGCAKVDLDVTIDNDDTVDGALTVALHVDAIEVFGPEESRALVESLTSDVAGAVDVEPFEEGGFVGRTVHFSDVPIDEFGTRQSGDDGTAMLHIEHLEGRFQLDGEWEIPHPGQHDEVASQLTDQELLDSADFTVSVTFPGRILEHDGNREGRTVTWDLDIGQAHTMHAVADDTNSTHVAWIVLATLTAAALAAAFLLYLQLRRHSLNRSAR